MNTSVDEHDEDPDLRFAEYVLGVLDADARAAVERDIAASTEAAAAECTMGASSCFHWQSWSRSGPGRHIWPRIASATRPPTRSRAPTPGLQDNVVAMAGDRHRSERAAAVLLVFVLLRPAPTLVSPSYLESDDPSREWRRRVDRNSGPAARPPDRGTRGARTHAAGTSARAVGHTGGRKTRCAWNDCAGATRHIGTECHIALSGGTDGQARGLS